MYTDFDKTNLIRSEVEQKIKRLFPEWQIKSLFDMLHVERFTKDNSKFYSYDFTSAFPPDEKLRSETGRVFTEVAANHDIKVVYEPR